ncbi:MAG TPA: hotdog fold thioesterase [Candidatus Marinimicrobia bacterium]|nr:hotdog fold thioesterase [Candidatus Neomarinimicrobiota bacterium]
MSNPRKIINKMFDQDAFSQWLGIEIIDVSEGFCQLKMTVRKEMLNGFQIAHGGIAYSLADSALAFASNSHGRKSLSVETSISHTVSVKEGNVLTAATEELSLSDKIGVYLITITNQSNEDVAYFKGTVYRTSKEWFPNDE